MASAISDPGQQLILSWRLDRAPTHNLKLSDSDSDFTIGFRTLLRIVSAMRQSTGKTQLVEPPPLAAPDSRVGAVEADGKRLTLTLAATFFAMFCVVGIALWGLPFYYDFMVQQFGWTRGQVTSGNALGKLLIGPAFGFIAGWVVDRFGPRRLLIAGIVMAGTAVAGLGSISTLPWLYFFYSLNALAFVCGGPLP